MQTKMILTSEVRFAYLAGRGGGGGEGGLTGGLPLTGSRESWDTCMFKKHGIALQEHRLPLPKLSDLVSCSPTYLPDRLMQ